MAAIWGDAVRRSFRVKTIDLNGRGYLSDQLGWSVNQLEDWLTSEPVQSHIRTWHRRCVEDPSNYNVVLHMVNNGVFEIKNNEFEEDLLLASIGDFSLYSGDDKNAVSYTMDLWASAVRAVVQSSLEYDYVFKHLYRYHPARSHGIVIDLLCIAFHSLAHRGKDSCYQRLFCGRTSNTKIDTRQERPSTNQIGQETWEPRALTLRAICSAPSESACSLYTDDSDCEDSAIGLDPGSDSEEGSEK